MIDSGSIEYKECLGVDKKVCENIGGKFNECASACRNDPKAEVCTMQCVLICEFKQKKERFAKYS